MHHYSSPLARWARNEAEPQELTATQKVASALVTRRLEWPTFRSMVTLALPTDTVDSETALLALHAMVEARWTAARGCMGADAVILADAVLNSFEARAIADTIASTPTDMQEFAQ